MSQFVVGDPLEDSSVRVLPSAEAGQSLLP